MKYEDKRNQDIRIQAHFLFFVGIFGILACISVFSFAAVNLILGATSAGAFTAIVSSVTTIPFVGMVKTAHKWLKNS